MIKLSIILFCCCVASVYDSKAQKNTFKITGAVIDSTTKQTLPFGYVSLLKNDSTVVATTETKSEGQYTFSKIISGNYRLKISYVGYAIQEKNISQCRRKRFSKQWQLN